MTNCIHTAMTETGPEVLTLTQNDLQQGQKF